MHRYLREKVVGAFIAEIIVKISITKLGDGAPVHSFQTLLADLSPSFETPSPRILIKAQWKHTVPYCSRRRLLNALYPFVPIFLLNAASMASRTFF